MKMNLTVTPFGPWYWTLESVSARYPRETTIEHNRPYASERACIRAAKRFAEKHGFVIVEGEE